MFDFSNWREWLEQAATRPAGEGVKAEFTSGPNESPKLGMVFGVIGVNAMGSFECWITGETDFTIMAPPSAEAKMVSHKWMQVLTDKTFEAAFNEFMAEFHKYENRSLS
jgi:hypothetical protein